MSFVRTRYRQPSIQPELSQPRQSSIQHKKVKPQEEKVEFDANQYRHQDPVFLPSHTQIKRKEVLIYSDEEAFRSKQNPTVAERLQIQRVWAEEQLAEVRNKAQQSRLEQIRERNMQIEKDKILANIERANSHDDTISMVEEFKNDDFEDDNAKKGDVGQNNDFDSANDQSLEEDPDFIEVKERKIMSYRNNKHLHLPISRFAKRSLAFRLKWGFHTPARELAPILPWLVLGRKDIAANRSKLLHMGVTHILNMTYDIPNYHPSLFVYQRIPIKDDTSAEIGEYFSTIINFIQRVEDLKGQILVHCTAGVSRAPTAIMAYLIMKKQIPLADVFELMKKFRPFMNPNRHFLMQLALLEIELGLGSSVSQHKEWRFFEFIDYRSMHPELEKRSRIGVSNAVWRLYDRHNTIADVLTLAQQKPT